MSENEKATVKAVVIGDTLLCEGIRSLFAGSRYTVQHECSSIEMALPLAGSPIQLVLVAVPIDAAALEPMRRLRSAFAQSRIVLYALSISVGHQELRDLFATCLDGCLAAGASVDVVRQSLDLLMAGGHVFPFSPQFYAVSTGEDREPLPQLSGREREVIRHLREGKSNKTIARELDLSESTVKAHVKRLMRKLGVHNRTEAAIWATEHRSLPAHARRPEPLEFSERF